MNRFVIRPEAEAEIEEAADWYAARSGIIAIEFIHTVDRVLNSIRENAGRYPIVDRDIRRALLPRFPYVIHFRANDNEIVVLECSHVRRKPRNWRRET